MKTRFNGMLVLSITTLLAAGSLSAQSRCADLPSHAELTAALRSSIAPTGGPSNGGWDFHAWAVIVNREGQVCAVTKSGANSGDQFPISRLAAAQKAGTANANSLDFVAVSTAILYSSVQPGAPGFSLQLASPVDPRVAFPDPTGTSSSNAARYGTPRDPLVGKVLGGFSTLGGGLPLYSSDRKVIGGLGIGGDTACGDHNIAWRVRRVLGLDHVTFGPNPQNGDDGIVYDIGEDGVSESGLGYPFCGLGEPEVAIEIGAGSVPDTQ